MLRLHRIAAGLTQEALAERAGLSVFGVQKLERGTTRPYRVTAARLAAALDLAPEQADRLRAALKPVRRRGSMRREQGAEREPVAAKRRHNLPAQRLRLIGREQDVLATHQVLLGTDGRLLTLTGAGGCGKTRLALELAADLLPNFPDGVWLVEPAAVADPMLVPQTVASTLSIRERPEESLIATLVRALSKRELLLVLDNCEHVIEVCAEIAEKLIDHCPRLRVLATSREALRITGERTWRVPSLRVPDQLADADDLLRSPAVQLFVERAQASVPSFDPAACVATLGGICRRLDGLPLAIELAAARVRTLGVDQILERLDDSIQLLVGGSRTAAIRQQTLRATLDWSYGLLRERDQAVFRRLAVFAESCSLGAAETVCADNDVAAGDVLDLLQRLVDKSVVVVEERDGQARYHLLEPIRQYAEEQLITCGERGATRRRHADYCLVFAEERWHYTNVGGARRFIATRELAREYPNLHSALAWSVENEQTQIGLRLATSFLFLWQVHGSVNVGLKWLGELFALPGADEPTRARAGALLTLARLAESHGDLEKARASSEEALALARRLADPLLEYLALLFCANNAGATGDAVTMDRFAREALACADAAGDPLGGGSALMLLAVSACSQADYVAAQPLAERALRLARLGRDAWNEAWALAMVGRVALGTGAIEHAKVTLQAALAMAEQQGEPLGLIGLCLDDLAKVEIASNHPHQARAWLVRSLKLRNESGEAGEIAQTLEQLAAVAAMSGQAERALRLAGMADALRGPPPTRVERQMLERWLEPLRHELTQEAANPAWAAGGAMQLEEAIALACAVDESDEQQPAVGQHARAGVASMSILTARERQVAELLALRLTNRQIAERLVITERTVASHIEHILEKLGFASRHQVGALVVERDVLD